ncbi:MAG: DUF3987 domain-containing protein [Proteobacteria bacterium]|nr:DUF3987 domain-containing protein [Pseudomonadota bacterium]
MLTYEPISFIPLTGESWSEENKSHWDQTITNACEWADRSSSVAAVLSQEAQERFISWRNELGQQAITLPALFRGFMPKAWGYALRLAGILHLLECFSAGLEPAPVLSLRDIERGIITAEFYLGQAFDAIRLIVTPDQSSPTEPSKESHLLARALDELRSDIDKGKLAVGFIAKKYNQLATKDGKLEARMVGELLRKCGLPPADSKFDANGSKRVKCLRWSDAVEAFINKSLASQARELDHQQRLSKITDPGEPNLLPLTPGQGLEDEVASPSDVDCRPHPTAFCFPDKWDPDADAQSQDLKRQQQKLNNSQKPLPVELPNYPQ